MQMRGFRMFRPLALIAPLLLWAAPALAEGNCPPGYFPIGGGDAGWEGCAPMGGDSGYDDGYGDDGYYDAPPPYQYTEQDWADWAREAAEADARRRAALQNDPVLQQLAKGSWDFEGPGKDKTRRVCQATYLSLAGGVMLMDWAGPEAGTYLGFFGPSIPAVKRMKKTKVSLIQSGQTQTVRAFQAPLPWNASIGMVLFAVPSTQALIGAIEDSQDFEVQMKGKTVIKGEWHGGARARDWLKRCTSGR